LEQAQRVCNRFGLMHKGKKVLTGSLEDLQQQTGKSDLVEMFIDLIENDNVAPIQQV
jgi:ABC-2 type transport system ATP-binding protein/sodium transport system ATP-binding protein